MTKQEFLTQLQNGLCVLTELDAQERLNFYSEMIDDRIEEGDTLRLDGLYEALPAGRVTLTNVTKGITVPLVAAFTERQIAILRAGGLLPYTKGE